MGKVSLPDGLGGNQLGDRVQDYPPHLAVVLAEADVALLLTEVTPDLIDRSSTSIRSQPRSHMVLVHNLLAGRAHPEDQPVIVSL